MRFLSVIAALMALSVTVKAGEESIRGVLEKTVKPGACAQITDALADVYYVSKTDEAEKAVAKYVGKNEKVVVTGTVETKEGDPAYFLNLKSAEPYAAKLPPAPAPVAVPAAEPKAEAKANRKPRLRPSRRRRTRTQPHRRRSKGNGSFWFPVNKNGNGVGGTPTLQSAVQMVHNVYFWTELAVGRRHTGMRPCGTAERHGRRRANPQGVGRARLAVGVLEVLISARFPK